MKGEYVVESQNENMFSKLHLPNQNPNQNHPFPHHFHLSRESQTPESDEITTPNTAGNNPNGGSGGGGDGASIEVGRRPRGRPPGSKNKPKPPLIITREPEPAMSPYILEVQGGNDVVEAITRFSRRKNLGICVLTGSGSVSNVTLRQPSTTPGATITFHGRFDLLSLSATLLPQSAAAASPLPDTFSISLAGPQGQIVGGFVAGPLIAVGTVFVISATFTKPSFHRLPGGDEESRNPVSSGGGGEGGSQSPPMSGGGVESGGHRHGGGGGESVSMYGGHMGGSDVIWTPNARPPPPY